MGRRMMPALAAALALAFAGGAGGDLVVPAWDAPTPHDEVCVEVPKTLTSPYANNSRWGFVALPRGAPPAGGWAAAAARWPAARPALALARAPKWALAPLAAGACL